MSKVLRDWTTFGIGGEAKELIVADSRPKLVELAPEGLVIGGGSNLLVSDDGYDGKVIVNRYADFERSGNLVRVGSGMKLPKLCSLLRELGLGGMEWAVGIPGTVGGAVKMNAGAFGHSISENIASVEILRGGKLVELKRDEIGFAYRQSGISDGDTVVSATFMSIPRDKADVERDMAVFARMRALRQPRGKSAGSIFKNPDRGPIAFFIEGAGLKGLRVGGAMISREHANIIVNTGGAAARDVKAIIDIVKAEMRKIHIEAQEEIIYVGDFG